MRNYDNNLSCDDAALYLILIRVFCLKSVVFHFHVACLETYQYAVFVQCAVKSHVITQKVTQSRRHIFLPLGVLCDCVCLRKCIKKGVLD